MELQPGERVCDVIVPTCRPLPCVLEGFDVRSLSVLGCMAPKLSEINLTLKLTRGAPNAQIGSEVIDYKESYSMRW